MSTQGENLNIFTKTLLWCAGVEIRTFEDAVEERKNSDEALALTSEIPKYQSIGIIICLTAILALLSGSFAISYISETETVFERTNLLAASVYSIFIFSLDRFFVSSTTNEEGFWRNLLKAYPRIFIALVFSYLIAIPLEVKIFEKEIETEGLLLLQDDKSVELRDTINLLKVKRDSLESFNRDLRLDPSRAISVVESKEEEIKIQEKIDKKEGELSAKREEVKSYRYDDEYENADYYQKHKDTPTPEQKERWETEARVPKWKSLWKKYGKSRKERDALISDIKSLKTRLKLAEGQTTELKGEQKEMAANHIKVNNKRIGEIDTLIDEKESEIDQKKDYNGLLARHEALWKMVWDDFWGVGWMVLVVTLFFLLMELAPILSKAMLPMGAYDFMVKEMKELHKAHVKSKKNKMKTSNISGRINTSTHAHPSIDASTLAQNILGRWEEDSVDLFFHNNNTIEIIKGTNQALCNWNIDSATSNLIFEDNQGMYEIFTVSYSPNRLVLSGSSGQMILYRNA